MAGQHRLPEKRGNCAAAPVTKRYTAAWFAKKPGNVASPVFLQAPLMASNEEETGS